MRKDKAVEMEEKDQKIADNIEIEEMKEEELNLISGGSGKKGDHRQDAIDNFEDINKRAKSTLIQATIVVRK